MAKINEEKGSDEDDLSEDNEEGINIDIGDEHDEEHKEESKTGKKAKKTKPKDSEEEDDDNWIVINRLCIIKINIEVI